MGRIARLGLISMILGVFILVVPLVASLYGINVQENVGLAGAVYPPLFLEGFGIFLLGFGEMFE